MNNKPHKFKQNKTIVELIIEFEAMSHKGTVGFFEKTEFIQLLDYYERKQLNKKALTVVEHAISQHPFSADFHIRKAQLFLEEDQASKALDCLDKAEIFAPSDIQISLVRAEAYTIMGFYEEALSLLDDLMSCCEKEYLDDIYICKAMVHEDRNEHDLMFHTLREALLLNPKNEVALKRIWYCVDISGKYEESIQLHLNIIDEDPYSYVAWYNLGYAYMSIFAFEKAIDAFEYAFIINSKFEFAYRDCAEACMAIGRYEKAIEVYEEAMGVFLPDGELLMKLGLCYDELGFPDKAKAYYFRGINMEPENAAIYFQLGLSYASEKCWAAAANSFKKAVKLNDRKEEYIAALANAHYHLGDNDLAAAYFYKATELAPEDSDYWVKYVHFLLEIQKTGEAIDVLDEANLYATGADLLYCRVACLLKLGYRKKALYLLGEVLHEDFLSHYMLFKLDLTLATDDEVNAVIKAYKAERKKS